MEAETWVRAANQMESGEAVRACMKCFREKYEEDGDSEG
jgi:hypothetical protein